MKTMIRQLCTFVLAVLLCGAARLSAQEYDVLHIELHPDAVNFGASAMNNYGQIVGTFTHAGTFQAHGYFYDGQMHDLGPDMTPLAISDDAKITGESSSGEAFLYDYTTGTITPLGTLGGTFSVGKAVNTLGEAAGESDMPGTTPNRAFLYSGGAMINLGIPQNIGTLVTEYTKANALNDAGLVAGEALVGYGGERWAVPFVYDSVNNPQMLKLSGTYISGSAWAMNELGHVVGWTSNNEDTWGKAFLHDGATMTSLGTITGKAHTIATAINIHDEVVGQAFGEWVWQDWCQCNVWTNAIKRGFLYRQGEILDLNTLLPATAEGESTTPLSINDSGKILTPLGGEHVVLAPVVTADADNNGYIEPVDLASFVDCLGGPDADPRPESPMEPSDCVRLFDFDRDYDVDTHDYGRLSRWMTHPGRIDGAVEYTGSEAGDIHVIATGTTNDFEYSTVLHDPGAYSIALWRTGDYEVAAFLDVNGNGLQDAGEPFAPALTDPLHVAGEGGLVEDVLIDLGPYMLSGSVAYEDDTPAAGVTISVDGPTITSTTTGPDGSYALVDLLGGDYVVTPSDSDRYFYAFDEDVHLVGQDIADVDFEAHDLPLGEVDGEAMGIVSAVDLPSYSITINDEGVFTVVYVYADTAYSGYANSLEEVTVGHAIEAQYYTPSNLAVHIDTDPVGAP